MKNLLFLVCISIFCFGQDRMATVSGNCFLQNQSDHSGAMVLFEALSPSAVTDSVFTSEVGSYTIGLSEGIYAVHFSKDNFYPYTLPATPTFGTDSYTIEDVELLDGGSILMVSGAVSGEWTSDVLYLVEDNLVVNSGETLMIHAGTTVKFMGNYSFNVDGSLYAMGEENNMITFTSGQPLKSPGDWQGIKFQGQDEGFLIECWNFNDEESCSQYEECNWTSSWVDMNSWCNDDGGMDCWQYGDQGSCDSADGCYWSEDGFWETYCGGGDFYYEAEQGTSVIEFAAIEYGQYGLYLENTYDNNITILNNTIQYSSSYGIRTSSSGPIISGNTIKDNNSHGIYLSSSNPIISGNIIKDNNNNGISSYVYDSTSGPMISDNTIENNSYDGIYMSGTGQMNIIDNTIRENGVDGIKIQESVMRSTQTITGNLVENNSGRGIYISYSTNIDVSNNIVRDNNNYGVYLYNIQNSTVSHNTIDGNNSYGMYIRYGDNSKVMHNIITGCNNYGVKIENWDEGIDFSYNNVWDNNNGNNFYSSDDSPPELGEMIATNDNDTDCDTYFNISENPLFVNPPNDNNNFNLGWDVNPDSSVTFQLFVQGGMQEYFGSGAPYTGWNQWTAYDDYGDGCMPMYGGYDMQLMDEIEANIYEITFESIYSTSEFADEECNYYTTQSIPNQFIFSDCNDYYSCAMTWQLPIDLINNPNNPLSFDPPDDFNLQENSPCIDAGNPADEYFDPDDTVADMGAFPFFQGTPLAPNVDFTASSTDGTAPLPVQFTHVNTGGPITTYSWNFGDGATSTSANPVHTYMSDLPDSFSVSLTVEGPGGADVIEYIDLISVIPITFPPVSNFTSNTQVSFGDVQFVAQSNGQVDTYSWDFGDGNGSSEQNPLHSYDSTGYYSVSLTVSGSTGSDTETKTNYIQILEPEIVIAGFELASTSGITPFTAMFTNTSMGTIEGYQWSFGDGQSSEDQNPAHTYTDPGSYMATLIVIGMINSDTTSQEITALSAAPIITSISDVPNDQGGRVYVSFAGSGYDTNTPNRNEQYAVERQDNDIWVNVGSGPAYGQSSYTFEVTTLSDSTSNGNAAAGFRIIASMDEGIWISEAFSGYSIDNLAPSAPSEFSAQYENGSINLSWGANSEGDLAHYNVYRDGELLTSVSANSYFDDTVMMGQSYEYSLTAVDIHDNESELSTSIAVETLFMGDINFDGTLNVLDVMIIVNIILPNDMEFTDEQLAAADLDGNGSINILDIMIVVNIILPDGLARGESISLALLEYGNGKLKIQSDGSVAGIELHLSGDYIITHTYLPSGWEFHSKDHTVLIFNLGGDYLASDLLFEYEGTLSVEENIIADWYGNGITAKAMVLPEEFALKPAYPNPFNPVTNIEFALPVDTEVIIQIYNLQGRVVATLLNGAVNAGYKSITWNADSHSSGVYFVHMYSGDYSSIQKLMLVK